ncbi:MAG: RHS repeat-associated core domain-containing protein, partial [Rhodococcus sp. (in: high G+C Gram-positive bacteria)]
LVAMNAYLPFGGEIPDGELDGERHKFTGHERDNLGNGANALDYMHARHYNPNLGRFLSVDPVTGSSTIPQSWNRYGYALNNPLRLVDKAGRCNGLPDDVEPCIKPESEEGQAEVGEPTAYDPEDPQLLVDDYQQKTTWAFEAIMDGLVGVVELADPSPVTMAVRGVLSKYYPDSPSGSQNANAGMLLAAYLTMEEAKAGAGSPIMAGRIKDLRYPAEEYAKMGHIHWLPEPLSGAYGTKLKNGGMVEVHYWKNLITGLRFGFKFK